MSIETKFNIGDRIYHIKKGMDTTVEICDLCDGDGFYKVKNRKLSCVGCGTQGKITKYSKISTWYVQNEVFTIGQIYVILTNSPGVPGKEKYGNFAPQKKQVDHYMCVETGIGSGPVYDPKNMFFTKEEAQAECDKRNKEVL